VQQVRESERATALTRIGQGGPFTYSRLTDSGSVTIPIPCFGACQCFDNTKRCPAIRRVNRRKTTNRQMSRLLHARKRAVVHETSVPVPLSHYSSSDYYCTHRSCLTAVLHARFPHRPEQTLVLCHPLQPGHACCPRPFCRSERSGTCPRFLDMYSAVESVSTLFFTLLSALNTRGSLVLLETAAVRPWASRALS
jgi:hypothetical protein